MEDPKRPKILIVDDNHATQMLLKIVLGTAGYALHQATDGEEAKAFLEAHPHIELVILDLRMPKHGGVKLLEARQHSSVLQKIPVLILSGDSSLYDVASRFGIEHFLMKGSRPSVLIDLVKSIVPTEEPRWGA